MSGFRLPEKARHQMVLWEQSLDDAVPVDHPVRLVDELLESESFAPTFRDWTRDYVLVEGKPPYHPKTLTKLYLYGLLNGIRSSRQLEAACYNRVDVIWLMSGQRPDHSTIAGFVAKHQKRLREMFRRVLDVGIRARLVSLELVCVDGSKVEADAGRKSVKTEERIRQDLARVDEKIRALEAQWESNEKEERKLFGESVPWAPEARGDPKKRAARMQEQRARMEEALAALERRREEAGRDKPRAIAVVTDPDSRVMRGKDGTCRPNYNVQVAVESGTGMIVAADVSDHPDDCGALSEMVRQTQENCGAKPQAVSADSGYNSGEELKKLEDEKVTTYIPDRQTSGKAPTPEQTAAVESARSGQTLSEEQWEALPKDKKGHIKAETFVYDAAADLYRCPMKQVLTYQKTVTESPRRGTRTVRVYSAGAACASCPKAGQCCKDVAEGRTVKRDDYECYRERARQRLSTAEGRKKYKRRSQTAEPRFGEIKAVLRIRRFLRRGRERVKTEWLWICTAVNVRILLKHWSRVAAVL